MTETVTVQGEAAMLEAETSQAGEVIKTEQVTNLPLGRRNFMQLTFLTPMSTPGHERLPQHGDRTRNRCPSQRRTAARAEQLSD